MHFYFRNFIIKKYITLTFVSIRDIFQTVGKTMGQSLDKCLDTGRFVPLALQSTYIIRVKTGDKKNAGTDADVTIRLIDEDGETSPLLKLDVRLRDDFERGQWDEFKIRDRRLSLGPLCKIELHRNNAGVNADWFVHYIEVEDKRTKGVYIFPVHRWVQADRPLSIQHLDAVLPQYDKHREQRDAELEAKRKVYEYGRAGPGLPVMVSGCITYCDVTIFIFVSPHH
jgi:hypothetical protein